MPGAEIHPAHVFFSERVYGLSGIRRQRGGREISIRRLLTDNRSHVDDAIDQDHVGRVLGSVERLHPSHRIVSLSFEFTDDEVASLTKPEPPDRPMHRMPGTLYGDAVTDSIFVIDVAVPGNPAEFTVQLPPVNVNDKPIDVAPVRFLRKSSVYFPAQLM
jgi:hypothetical protein